MTCLITDFIDPFPVIIEGLRLLQEKNKNVMEEDSDVSKWLLMAGGFGNFFAWIGSPFRHPLMENPAL